MKAALTGGSGFIGTHLVDRLVSEGHRVRVLVREKSKIRLLSKLRAELVYGDVTDKRSLQRLVNGADVVYHLAAYIYGTSADMFWKVNYLGTRNVLEACAHRDLRRFVFTSTVTVMGSITDPPADETRLYNPTSPYDRSKCEAEKLALHYHQKFNMPVTIIRPAVVYGPGNMYHLKLCRWIKRGNLLIGNMNNRLHLSYIDNLIQGITLAAEKPKALGEVYIIADAEPITWRRYVYLIREAIGMSHRDGQIPVWTVKAAARMFEAASSMLGTDPLLASHWVEELTRNFAYDISKARRDLGYSPKVSLREGVSRTVQWYKRKGYLD